MLTLSTESQHALPRGALRPREHGAYAQLIFPQLTALLIAGPLPTSLLWCVAVIAGFFLHEPVIVLLGHRGSRAQRQRSHAARQYALRLVLLAVLSSIAALLFASTPARIAIFACLLAILPLAWLVFTKRSKTVLGELLAAGIFAASSLPILLEGGVSRSMALTHAATWTAIFAMGTLTVRGVIQHRKAPQGAMRLPFITTLVALAAALAFLPGGFVLAWVPTALTAFVLCAFPPHPRRLRTLGFTLVGTSTVAMVILIALL